jgi:hypothetical protein
VLTAAPHTISYYCLKSQSIITVRLDGFILNRDNAASY